MPSDIVAWDENGISEKVLDSFEKTAQYCKKNNIELVCVTTPITPSTVVNGYSEKAGEYFTRLCEEYGVEYYDFNLLTMDILPRTDDDSLMKKVICWESLQTDIQIYSHQFFLTNATKVPPFMVLMHS